MPRPRVDGDPVDVAELRVSDDGVEKIHRFSSSVFFSRVSLAFVQVACRIWGGSTIPQVVVDADLDADAAAARALHVALRGDGPSVLAQALPRLRHHVAHEGSLVHERGAEGFRARP